MEDHKVGSLLLIVNVKKYSILGDFFFLFHFFSSVNDNKNLFQCKVKFGNR